MTVFKKTSDCIRRFAKCEDGAVAVDWMVMTGLVMGLGVAVHAQISQPVADLVNGVSQAFAGESIHTALLGSEVTVTYDDTSAETTLVLR